MKFRTNTYQAQLSWLRTCLKVILIGLEVLSNAWKHSLKKIRLYVNIGKLLKKKKKLLKKIIFSYLVLLWKIWKKVNHFYEMAK